MLMAAMENRLWRPLQCWTTRESDVDNRDAATRQEQRALKISVAAALFFALLGFGFALLTHSQAILLDGIF